MNEIIEYLPFIIPIVLVELILMIVALIHLLKHKNLCYPLSCYLVYWQGEALED